jgi:hypothetical protein
MYNAEVMNRGQRIRLHFLNAAETQNQPTLWLDVLHKGVKVRFRAAQAEILGVRQPTAALVGIVLGFVLLGVMIAFVDTLWLAALGALIYGSALQIPGACVVKGWRRLREWFGG